MNGDRCLQPQCTGTLEDDYCDLCGMAAHQPMPSATQTFKTLSRRDLSSRDSSRQRTSSRSGLGLGLVSLPPLPVTDPEKLLLQNPSVPANKRFCGHCDHPVRRDRGFCGQCGHPYCFVPSLKAGDVVAQQYDVKGAIAYGGLGWLYLGFDLALSRYVVLKGLLNSGNASSAAVALAERQFLATVKHPNIVGVYNFVTHDNPSTHESEGYIVMEYVAGQTLRQIRREQGPLPVAVAVAYIHGILGAFGYLHEQGLVYCDFKPDNLMLEGDTVKLIDMGAVRRLNDPLGDIYGTVGYSAPEAGAGPTVASDLFTLGRTLAVLVATLPDFSEANRYQMPTPEQVPLFAQWESLYRWLCKATAPVPAHRFQSAEEMAEQLAGVLREVVALETGRPVSSPSRYFGGDEWTELSSPTQLPAVSLPSLLLDPEDSAYRAMPALLAIADPQHQRHQLDQLQKQFPDSVELKLQGIQLSMRENLNLAHRHLAEFPNTALAPWRSHWLRGKLRLLQGHFSEARQSFEQVCAVLPGEVAPRLALAQAAELCSDLARAQDLYCRVLQTDERYGSAAFGMARVSLMQGQRAEALAALQAVPATSPWSGRSRLDQVQIYLQTSPQSPAIAELQAAAQILDHLELDLAPQTFQQQRYLLLNTALYLLENQQLAASPSVSLNLGGACPLTVVDLRRGLEDSLRSLARLSQGQEHIWLVDQANQIRPRTWF